MKPAMRHPGPAAARIAVPEQPEHARDTDVLRWLAQMQADLAQSLGGIMLRAARAVPVGTADGGTSMVSSSPGRLVGWSLRETTGSAGFTVRLRNGTDSGQPLIACVAGAAGAVDTRFLAPGGVSFTEGLYVEILSGTVEGVVYLGAAE
jgi:hypothetical protein